ncbi:MAG: hypothetical protein GY714_01805 [Desulfobacterales bacterium]|nr:hypothetical protein [Desulfobacterales bacterium]
MQIRREKITPTKAKAILEKNEDNRKLSIKRVKDFAVVMKEGGWKEDNGETVTIDKLNNLLNGQHRLNAIVESGVSINIWVARGAEPEVKNSIDTGKARSVADIFSLNGEAYATQKASISRFIDSWIREGTHLNGSITNTLRGRPQLCHDQLLELYRLYSKEFEWACPLAEANIINGCSKGQLVFALMLLKINKPKAKVEEFLEFFKHGGDYRDSPTHRLPFYLISRRDGEYKRHRREDVFLVLHSYDLWEEKKPFLNKNIRLDNIINRNHDRLYKSYKMKGKWKNIITEEYFKAEINYEKTEAQETLL